MCQEYSKKYGTIVANIHYAKRKKNPVAYKKYLKAERKRRKRYMKKDPLLKASFSCQGALSSLFRRARKAAQNGVIFKPSDYTPPYNKYTIENSTGLKPSEYLAAISKKLQPGMTMGNYGRNGWHLEYINKPTNFNLLDPEECKKAFGPENCKPCWYAQASRHKVLANNIRKHKISTAEDFYEFFASIPEENWNNPNYQKMRHSHTHYSPFEVLRFNIRSSREIQKASSEALRGLIQNFDNIVSKIQLLDILKFLMEKKK